MTSPAIFSSPPIVTTKVAPNMFNADHLARKLACLEESLLELCKFFPFLQIPGISPPPTASSIPSTSSHQQRHRDSANDHLVELKADGYSASNLLNVKLAVAGWNLNQASVQITLPRSSHVQSHVKSSSPTVVYHTSLVPGKSTVIQPLQDCANFLQTGLAALRQVRAYVLQVASCVEVVSSSSVALTTIGDVILEDQTAPFDVQNAFSVSEILPLLHQVDTCLVKGMATLNRPALKTLSELQLQQRNHKLKFEPPLPDDYILDFFLHDCKFCMAVYQVQLAQLGALTDNHNFITLKMQAHGSVEWICELKQQLRQCISQSQALLRNVKCCSSLG